MCDIYDELKEALDRGELNDSGYISESYSDTVNKANNILFVLREITLEATPNTVPAFLIFEELQKPQYSFQPKNADEVREIAGILAKLGRLREKDYRPENKK